ncbi:MAG: DUF116 domain-containing protein [Natronincolaceae bacterium]|jgi:hypothetical protein|nr:DUF116 domain-containing protein [Bacillota bacterium]NLK91088.1 DUF116 domain-containing protein [Clostridiales bacterium]
MEIEGIPKTDNIYKKFISILLLMFSLTVISIVCLVLIVRGRNEYFYKSIFAIIITILFGTGLLLLGTIFIGVLLWHEHSVSKTFRRLLGLSFTMIYPGMLFLGKLFKYDKNSIRSIFIELNNRLVSIDEYSIKGNDILVLIPHCIQKSFCPHRITTNIENCKRCGKCSIDSLIKLKEEFGVNIRVVTGGTLARKVIEDLKPKAIVAIACERDLAGGLYEVRDLPVIAITNKRPEGPCLNTTVDINEVRAAIKHFLYKE